MHTDSAGFITRAAALADGYTDNEIAQRCARGDLRRVGSGLYVPAEAYDGLDPVARHRVDARAGARSRSGSVVSHVSAAALHGLDLWKPNLELVHLTVEGPTGGGIRAGRQGSGNGRAGITAGRHIHTRAAVESESVDGTPTTPLAHTVLDCARSLDLDHAVIIGDSALRTKRVSPAELAVALDRSRGLVGVPAARRAIASMNGLSESAGESLSRIRFREFGIPMPILQFVIEALGFRVDFYWPRFRIVGEFDGLAKYEGRGEVLAKEKAREDAIRDRGHEVIRWTWKDLFDFARVKSSFDRAVQRSGR